MNGVRVGGPSQGRIFPGNQACCCQGGEFFWKYYTQEKKNTIVLVFIQWVWLGGCAHSLWRTECAPGKRGPLKLVKVSLWVQHHSAGVLLFLTGFLSFCRCRVQHCSRKRSCTITQQPSTNSQCCMDMPKVARTPWSCTGMSKRTQTPWSCPGMYKEDVTWLDGTCLLRKGFQKQDSKETKDKPK